MRYGAFGLVLFAAGSLLSMQAAAQHADHIMLDPSELVWKDLPSLPGVKIAVIEGPLDQAVPIMFRLKFPPNFKVMPHWHPGIEHITIISGTLNMGIGRQVRYLQDAAAQGRQRVRHAAEDEPLCVDERRNDRADPQYWSVVGKLRQSGR